MGRIWHEGERQIHSTSPFWEGTFCCCPLSKGVHDFSTSQTLKLWNSKIIALFRPTSSGLFYVLSFSYSPFSYSFNWRWTKQWLLISWCTAPCQLINVEKKKKKGIFDSGLDTNSKKFVMILELFVNKWMTN